MKRRGRPKGTTVAAAAGAISVGDIAAVKALTDRLGAEKVAQLAAVLAK
jgi:hypothetical protein